jgi:hypothetical protein
MTPLRSIRLVSFLCLALPALTATATRAAMTPFELNMDRVKIVDPKGLAAPTYFVPAVKLIVTAQGSVWAQGKSTNFSSDSDVTAQAHGKYYVQGLEKALLQDLARKVQDDLVAKLRATGATVLTYDDLKADPLVAGRGRESADGKWGLPATSKGGLTYVMAWPSDEQAFESGVTGPLFYLRPMVKEKKIIAIQPEITFTVPQMWGEKDVGYKRAKASIAVNPVMLLEGAMIYVNNPQGSFTSISIQTHGGRHAAEVTGTVKKMSEDTTKFTSLWGRSTSDYLFTLDPAAFSDGVLRVGFAINSMIADQVKKVRK